MARLWSCGFESQSATSGVEWDTTTGTPAISTSTVRSGAASLRCNPSAATAFISHQVMANGNTTAVVGLRAYLYVASAPAALTTIMCWADSAANTSGWYGIKLSPSLTLTVNASGGTGGVASSTLSLNTWYRVELLYDDVANTATGYLDGTQFDQRTGYDLGGGNFARFGVVQSTTADLYLDDLAINDNTGSAQTGLPGNGRIVHLRPSGAGDNNGFATVLGGTAGAANNYTRVNELTPDSATSYNATTATGTTTIDDFVFDSPSSAGIGSNDTIRLVQIGTKVGSTATTAANIASRIKSQSAGTVAESASTSIAINGWATHTAAVPHNYPLTSYTDPQAGGAWTPSLLGTMQAGYRSSASQSTTRRVSTLWALVEYVPSTGTDVSGGTLTLSAASDLALTAQATLGGGASLAAGTALSIGQPAVLTFTTAALSAASGLSAAATATVSAGAALGAASGLTAAATNVAVAGATLTAASGLTGAAPGLTRPATVSLSGLSAMTVGQPGRTVYATVLLSAASDGYAYGRRIHAADAALSAASTLTLTSQPGQLATAALAGTSAVTVDAVRGRTAAATLSAGTALSGTAAQNGSALLTTASGLSAALKLNRLAGVGLSGISWLLADGAVRAGGSVAMSAGTGLQAGGTRLASVVAAPHVITIRRPVSQVTRTSDAATVRRTIP